MRFAMCVALLLASGAAAQDKKDVPKELAPFQGTWKVLKGELEGKPLPDNGTEMQVVFDGKKTIFRLGGKDAEKAEFTVDATKDPAEIDMIPTKGGRSAGIYKFDKDGKLTVLYSMFSTTRPKSFDEKDQKGKFLFVLEKIKAKE